VASRAVALGRAETLDGQSTMVVRGRVWRTWAGNQWSMMLKFMLVAGDAGQMGGGKRRLRRWMSDCHRQLPRRMCTAKGSHPGGVMGEEADQGCQRSGTHVGGGACSAWEYMISREEAVSA
jgi:hypothetical protein